VAFPDQYRYELRSIEHIRIAEERGDNNTSTIVEAWEVRLEECFLGGITENISVFYELYMFLFVFFCW